MNLVSSYQHTYTHTYNCHQLQSRWQAYEDHAKRLKQQEERKKAKELEEKEKRKRRREKLFLLLQSREEGKMAWIIIIMTGHYTDCSQAVA